jgi:peptidoglycan hydrolase-like protein with peptidoglycan-binding domain
MSVQIPGLTNVVIPGSITVHLGEPSEPAENVTVPFIDYVKNVASSEIYPTWPEASLKANIYAIISIALNRIYTEWYRSRGYNFDITNTTQYDQAFVKDRGIFDSIDRIVDEIFDEYIVRQGRIEPLFATFCDGRIAQCNGMYQWGTVDLAQQGMVPYEILQYYYGEDININTDTPIINLQETYPGSPLSLGDTNQYVLIAKMSLNTISANFPAIPKITPIDATFNESMEAAVREFQNIFNLPVTGVIDKATWYELRKIYVSVRRLAELSSRGILIEEIPSDISDIEEGQVVPRVQLVQYFINVLSAYYESIPSIDIDGILGPNTRAAIIEFQKTLELPITGLIDEETWNTMYNSVLGILRELPPTAVALPSFIYPNIIYREGTEGPDVFIIQELLAFISTVVPEIPTVELNGFFGPETTAAVIAFQRMYGIEPDGIVDEETWNKIVDVYRELRFGETRSPGQFPGTDIS